MHLSCPYVEDYTNQEYRAYFEMNSSSNLTCRILLETTSQMWQYYFFKTYTQTEGYQVDSMKRTVHSHKNTYLSLYTTCSSSILNMTGVYNTNGAR